MQFTLGMPFLGVLGKFYRNLKGLDALSLFSSSCPIVVKQCSISLGAMNEAEVLDAAESIFVIVFLMLSIFLK